MILLIRCDKEVKSYNKWTTTFNSDMSDVNDVFVSNGISTFLLYRSKLPSEFKKTSNPKRGISSISSFDFKKVEQDCIIFYHGDVLKEGDEVAIENLFNYCHIIRISPNRTATLFPPLYHPIKNKKNVFCNCPFQTFIFGT